MYAFIFNNLNVSMPKYKRTLSNILAEQSHVSSFNSKNPSVTQLERISYKVESRSDSSCDFVVDSIDNKSARISITNFKPLGCLITCSRNCSYDGVIAFFKFMYAEYLFCECLNLSTSVSI